MAEVIGIKEALSWIAKFHWTKVTLESDSLVCVQVIYSHTSFPSQFGLLVSDCKFLLEQLQFVSLRCVKLSANKVAHILARSSCFSSGRSNHDGFLSLE